MPGPHVRAAVATARADHAGAQRPDGHLQPVVISTAATTATTLLAGPAQRLGLARFPRISLNSPGPLRSRRFRI